MRGVLCLGLAILLACESPAGDTSPSPPPSPPTSTSPSTTTSPLTRTPTSPSTLPSTSTRTRTPPVRVAFTGDLSLALQVRTNLDKLKQGMDVPNLSEGYPFTHVRDRLQAADVLVGNLECVLSLRGERDTNHNPFRCTMTAPEVLKKAGFDLVSVANNHAMDYGRKGFLDMLKNLDAAEFPHFGRETFTRKPQAPVIHEIRGVKIGMLAYYWPPDLPLVDVQKARPEVDVLFVYMHWGMDDTAEPMDLQRKLGRDFIDAGVDVVVGTHAHVLQPTDWYEGKFIAYGLGNFVFSGMMHTEAHRVGAMLEVDIEPETKRLTHRMVKMRLEHDGAPRWVEDPDHVAPEQAPAAK